MMVGIFKEKGIEGEGGGDSMGPMRNKIKACHRWAM